MEFVELKIKMDNVCHIGKFFLVWTAICLLVPQLSVTLATKTILQAKFSEPAERIKDTTSYQYEFGAQNSQQILSSATTKCPSSSSSFSQGNHLETQLGDEQIMPAIIEWRLITGSMLPDDHEDDGFPFDAGLIMSDQVDDDDDDRQPDTARSAEKRTIGQASRGITDQGHPLDRSFPLSQYIAVRGGKEAHREKDPAKGDNWSRWRSVVGQPVGQQNEELLMRRKQHLGEKFHLKTRKQSNSPVGSYSFFARDQAQLGEQEVSEFEQQMQTDLAKPWLDGGRDNSNSTYRTESQVKVTWPSVGEQKVAPKQVANRSQHEPASILDRSSRFQSSLANAASIARQLAKQANSTSKMENSAVAQSGAGTSTPASVFAGGWTDRQLDRLDASFAADGAGSAWSPNEEDTGASPENSVSAPDWPPEPEIGGENKATVRMDQQLVPKYLGLGQLHKIEAFNGNGRTQARLSCQFGERNLGNISITDVNWAKFVGDYNIQRQYPEPTFECPPKSESDCRLLRVQNDVLTTVHPRPALQNYTNQTAPSYSLTLHQIEPQQHSGVYRCSAMRRLEDGKMELVYRIIPLE